MELEGQLHKVLSSGEEDGGSILPKLFANPEEIGLHVGTRGMPTVTHAWVKGSSQSRGLKTRRAISGTSTKGEYIVLIMVFEGLTH